MIKFKFPKPCIQSSLHVISPSYSPSRKAQTKQQFTEAVNFCQQANIQVTFSKYCQEIYPNTVISINNKRSDLHNALIQNSNFAIISSCGGEGAITILSEQLVFEANKAQKYIVGMSDTSVLLNALTYATGIISIYGIDFVYGLGEYTREKHLTAFLNMINNNDLSLLSEYNYLLLHSNQITSVSGRVMGGCLSSFIRLLGTPYDPIELVNEDFILFIEDIGQSNSQLISNLSQIRLSKGYKNYCKAIVLGSFMLCEQLSDLTIEQSIINLCKEDGLEIYKSNDFGHGVANMPLPIGSKLTINNTGVINFHL